MKLTKRELKEYEEAKEAVKPFKGIFITEKVLIQIYLIGKNVGMKQDLKRLKTLNDATSEK